MTIMERFNVAPEPKLNKLRALNSVRVSPAVPRGEQVPQSKLSPAPPKGANRTGVKVRK